MISIKVDIFKQPVSFIILGVIILLAGIAGILLAFGESDESKPAVDLLSGVTSSSSETSAEEGSSASDKTEDGAELQISETEQQTSSGENSVQSETETTNTTSNNATVGTSSIQQQTPSEPEPLSEEVQLKIRQEYYNKIKADYPDDPSIQNAMLSEITIRQHIATYNECMVLFMDAPGFSYTDMLVEIEYEGFNFLFYDGRRPTVYCNSEFTSFQKAYEKGWITKDNLKDLSLRFAIN